MGSPNEKFKCRVCKEKKTNPSKYDISVCEDCRDELFDELLNDLTDDELKDWVWGWLSSDTYMEIVRNWDSDTKADTIPELKKIIEKRS